MSRLLDSRPAQTLKATYRTFTEGNLTDWAAALTYYGILSIFPALIVLLAALGLVGEGATGPLVDNIEQVAPDPAREVLTGAIADLQRNQSTAGLLALVALLVALWSASGYMGAFMRASNVIWGVDDRPAKRALPRRLLITVALLLGLFASTLAVLLTGDFANEVGEVLGLGDAALTAWKIAKWPVVATLVAVMLGGLYRAAPAHRHGGFLGTTAGSFLAVCLWLLASAAFGYYVSNFGSYNRTYGALGTVIAFSVWLWITNLVILLGATFDAAIEKRPSGDERGPDEAE